MAKSTIGKKLGILELQCPEIKDTTIADLYSPNGLSITSFCTWEGHIGVIDVQDLFKADAIINMTAEKSSGKRWPFLRTCLQEESSEPDCYFGSANGDIYKLNPSLKAPALIYKCGGPVVGLKWSPKTAQLFIAALSQKVYVYQEAQNTVQKIKLPERPINLFLILNFCVVVYVNGCVSKFDITKPLPTELKPEFNLINGLQNATQKTMVTAATVMKFTNEEQKRVVPVIYAGFSTGQIIGFDLEVPSSTFTLQMKALDSYISHILYLQDSKFVVITGTVIYFIDSKTTATTTGNYAEIPKLSANASIVAATEVCFQKDGTTESRVLVSTGYNWNKGGNFPLQNAIPQPKFYLVTY
ncbi:hypothetical protein TVAG_458680 [Trichomonas vaginalis G3]|uniref:Uncharacterized protein n=1 Tax=Trichomonas vaginalis (strain ATCC PRA-98 / G3) TaxID=412133 RepID=A2E673_TRIV3|nr:WD40 repeat-like family [Trichomonas vaginalis G3]EAY11796.1 hypothetical protein TVAG_458680 [Trichomonas vaginalis G3]KAI5534202.1 WD40 repeat-like family [Trichomonas vaginalis G3]|eukprot:XP_001324019.1 hypothetical protein [Trichomonas vaginalis G3]